MNQKNLSFWFCTLLSGIVIGIASQRIPGSTATNQEGSNSYYCDDNGNIVKGRSRYPLATKTYPNPSWMYSRSH